MTESTSTAIVEREVTEADLRSAGFPEGLKMATGLAIHFNEALYQRIKAIAFRMSDSPGIVGEHLLGKPNACFAVVSRSITWNLDPFAVAQATYAVNGKIGYEGKLIQAILENSGQLEGRVTYKWVGDWSKLRGKFKFMISARNSDKKTPVIDWKEEDEEGLSVIVSAQIKGETTPREEEFFLREMWPRNSTLWPTRPRQQMGYASVRAFANIACPGVLMGVPFDIDPSGFYDGTGMETINPTAAAIPARPEKPNAFARPPEAEAEKPKADDAPVTEGQQVGSDTPSPAEGGEQQAQQAASEEPEETPLQRGERLLKLCKNLKDVADLRVTILEEILDDDVAQEAWDKACDARGKELTPNTAKKKP